MTAFSPEGLSLRGLLSRLIGTLPDLNDHLAAQIGSLAVTYPPTTPGAHPLTGTRAPDLALGHTSLFGLLRADSYLLIDLISAATRSLAHLARPDLRVRTGAPHLPPAGWSGIRAALIRPDGHVAWAAADGDDTTLVRSLTAVLAGTHRN
ncbi:hypothetical protein ABZ553_08080 [Streptomyces sparsogenes]|uniref:aromatic-ring hydroxylase C-terminal domain-containing protein n=1 Tax=Streptomyces sparsogenes TaxID=67365 RepID=UPI0033DE491E